MGKVSKITRKWVYVAYEDFIKKYDENSDAGYFLDVDVEHLKKLFGSHKELSFLLERRKL